MNIENKGLTAAQCLRPILCRLVADPSRLDEPLLECLHEYLFAPTECRFKTPDKEIREAAACLKAIVDMEGIGSCTELRRFFARLDRQTDGHIANVEKKRALEQQLKGFRPQKPKLLFYLRMWKTGKSPAGLITPASQYVRRCRQAFKSMTRAWVLA